MPHNKTLFDKLWDDHTVSERADGQTLLYVDRLYTQENSYHAYNQLRRSGRQVRRRDQVFSFADHYVPTVDRHLPVTNQEIRRLLDQLPKDTHDFGTHMVGINDERQGILHVVPPEQGMTLPGMVIAGADSHTATHGAFASFAFGAGVSDIAHVMATSTLWRKKPRNFLIEVNGSLPKSIRAKDMILKVIATIGVDSGVGHVFEYRGSAISALDMEARMTVCNMSIEAGARAGLIAVDEITIDYVKGRPFAPAVEHWPASCEAWRQLRSDENAHFDKVVKIDISTLAPMVTWGTSPEDAVEVTDAIPNPDDIAHEQRRERQIRALDYMGLKPGQKISDITFDQVFIGSCTNSRLSDIRQAARIAKGQKARLPAWVVPGSKTVKTMAEAEGLDKILIDAGFQWREPGCSMCVGVNGDNLPTGTRCASTSNRNFEGRQGRGARTHLMSPAMAAAVAIHGHPVDIREMSA